MAKKSISYNPQVLDLTLYAGDGAGMRFTLTDSDNLPLNVTGAVVAQIRLTRDAPDPALATFAVDVTDGADGIVVISLTGDQTLDLAPEEKFVGVWDLEWTATNSEPMTLCQGKVECLPDVTH
jgi:hypothetical protein